MVALTAAVVGGGVFVEFEGIDFRLLKPLWLAIGLFVFLPGAWGATVAIITIDQRGIIESFNAAAERTFRYTADQVIGRNVSMLAPQPHQDRHDDYLQHYLQTGERKVIGIGREVIGLRRDGTTFPMELAVSEAR